MAWWTDHVLPHLVDVTLSQKPVMTLRSQVCAGLHGKVIEVGFGSGLNLASLPPEVSALDAVEPADVAWQRSTRRREASGIPITRIGLDGQRIDAPDGAYDSALVTFALCTISDPVRALSELHRVLRPGGELHFAEHGLAPDEGVRRWQRRLEPVQRCVAGGCHLTRDPQAMIAAAGFDVVEIHHRYAAPGPGKPYAYLTWGRALRRDLTG